MANGCTKVSVLNYPSAEGSLTRRLEHCNMIRGLVLPEKLLEWTVEDEWEPLCKFLDKPIPEEPFPHVNKASGWDYRVAETSKRYMWSALPGLAIVTTATVGLGAIAYKVLY